MNVKFVWFFFKIIFKTTMVLASNSHLGINKFQINSQTKLEKKRILHKCCADTEGMTGSNNLSRLQRGESSKKKIHSLPLRAP